MDRQALIDFLTWVRDRGQGGEDPEVIVREWWTGEWSVMDASDALLERAVDAYLASQEAARAKVWGATDE